MNETLITVNGKTFSALKKKVLLDVLKENNIDVPCLCYRPELDNKKSCGLCLVEVNGKLKLACKVRIKKNLDVKTDTEEIKEKTKEKLKDILSRHLRECHDCVWLSNCQLLELARKYQVNKTSEKELEEPVKFGFCMEFDPPKCISCENCIKACQKQGIRFLRSKKKRIVFNEKAQCIDCGQCIVNCPVGAFESTGEFEEIERCFQEKDKIKIFQIAPAVRASIGEEFNYPPGTFKMGELTAALKEMGADYVFDVTLGADFTSIEEAQELIERIEKKEDLPLITSCCPAWVKYLEHYRPDLIPHLTSVRSPHIILGGLIKTYWALKNNVSPDKISVISIMPCVAKKYEISREELKIKDLRPVDYVLTVREIARLIKRRKIDFNNIKPRALDDPFSHASGSAVIYGSSGGVMESALRTVARTLNYKEFDYDREQGKVVIGPHKLKIGIVNGLGNLDKVLKNLKKYHYVEVMACPGGCVGGGGQPLSSDPQVKTKRAQTLQDLGLKATKRTPNDNPVVKEIYQEFLNDNRMICHAKYLKK
jgi:iron-only hydrogenase group A